MMVYSYNGMQKARPTTTYTKEHTLRDCVNKLQKQLKLIYGSKTQDGSCPCRGGNWGRRAWRASGCLIWMLVTQVCCLWNSIKIDIWRALFGKYSIFPYKAFFLMSYAQHFPSKNLLLMRKADIWVTPHIVRKKSRWKSKMEVMCYKGQRGKDSFWLGGEAVHRGS